MNEIRILLIGIPGVLRDVIANVIGSCPDMTVVAVATDPAHAPEGTYRDVDVVVCSAPGSAMDDACERLLAHRRVKLLAINDDGRHAALWELRPTRTELGELSPRRLVETIRSVHETNLPGSGRQQ